MDAQEERAGGGYGHAVTPVRYVALPLPRGVHGGGGWTVLSMDSEWTLVHVPAAAGVVRVASTGGGVPEVPVDMTALNRLRSDDPDHLHLRSGPRATAVWEEGGAGGPCYVPVVFVLNPNKEAEKKEVKWRSRQRRHNFAAAVAVELLGSRLQGKGNAPGEQRPEVGLPKLSMLWWDELLIVVSLFTINRSM
uniref:Uncharacterized protein n=1 Tax=Oryza punctata TaxID=4537 RepID=A0A0E0JS63_ORYPU